MLKKKNKVLATVCYLLLDVTVAMITETKHGKNEILPY